MESVWDRPDGGFESLNGDAATDVLVIGGGLAGLLCAYMLRRAGVDCILAEARDICGGVTKNTTAKVTVQHGFIYQKLIAQFGVTKARMYLDANLAALEEYRRICRGIDCGFEEKDSYVYSLDERQQAEKEIYALKRMGCPAELTKTTPLPLDVTGAVRFKAQAQLQPLRFAAEAARGLRIYEHTPIRELEGVTAVTDRGRIAANKVIIATHFPILNKHGGYFIKMYQQRSYVIALEHAREMDGMYVDGGAGGLSFRSYGGLLLLGGGSHRTGKKGGGWRELRSFAALNYPNAEEKFHWATQDCMTLDGVPYIGRYSSGTENLYVATGFNKWGMTSSMAAAMLLRDMITGRDAPNAEVFSPSRTVLRPQLAVNALEAATGLLTPTRRRCPHLGCALKWNEHEQTWDCPCHGSRFDSGGRLLDNPATGGLRL